MSGYGFYEEEDEVPGPGIITGAGAIPKRRFIVQMAVNKEGKGYPKRIGYTLEYAVKRILKKRLTENNIWLQTAAADEKLQQLRQAVGERK
jgi:hypothetical protein